MTMKSVLQLAQGSVVQLDKTADTPADVYVNDRLIAHGEVVVVDNRFGIKSRNLSPLIDVPLCMLPPMKAYSLIANWVIMLGLTPIVAAQTNAPPPLAHNPSPPISRKSGFECSGPCAWLAVFFIIIALMKNGRRFLPMQKGKQLIQVVDFKPLAHRQCLYVIQCDTEQFLVGAGPNGVSLVSALQTQDAVSTATTSSFESSLENARHENA